MIRKALGLAAAVAGVGALIASQRQDIDRYLKIRQMSKSGDPSLVPARGRAAYPTHS